MVKYIGTSGDDVFTGTKQAADEAYGLDGNDTLTGVNGDDALYGGNNEDLIYGGDANDRLWGGAGADLLDGGGGDDKLYAGVNVDPYDGASNDIGTEYDRAFGGAGDDLISIGYGDDADGGIGTDTLVLNLSGAPSGVTFDTASFYSGQPLMIGGGTIKNMERLDGIFGSNFADTLTIATQATQIYVSGGGGNDTIITGGGPAFVDGGAGDDYIIHGSGAVYFSDLLGVNTIDYHLVDRAVVFDYSQGANSLGDSLTGTFHVIGTDFDDVFLAFGRVDGGGGSDTVSFLGSYPAGVSVSLTITGQQDTKDGLVTLISIENLIGSNYDDWLGGNAGDNILDGGAGLDIATYAAATEAVTVSLALAGAQDTIGAGVDTLRNIEGLAGSDFDDHLTGNAGDNTLLGGKGDDLLDGGDGLDIASYADATSAVTVNLSVVGAQSPGGGAGTDTLVSIEGLEGSAYNDTLTGSDLDNRLSGGDGDDKLYGGLGADILIGQKGADQLFGRAGDDQLQGNEGNDILEGGAGDDRLDGGDGYDQASYAGATSGVTVDLRIAGPQDTIGAGIDTLVSIEGVIGSDYNDILIGVGVLTGGKGDDLLDGIPGSGVFDGGDGNDTVTFARATTSVAVVLDPGNQFASMQSQGSALASIENVIGSNFNDLLYGDAGDNRLWGGDGDDELYGRGGNDSLYGGAGRDTANFSYAKSGVVVNLAIAGPQDTKGGGVQTLDSIENLTGSNYADVLIGDAGDNNLYGGAGDNTLEGGLGKNTLRGNQFGVDTASYAGAAAGVTVDLSLASAQNTGGAGTDTLVSIENLTGSAFNDILLGSAGDNRLDGGAGIDTASYANAASGVTVSLAIAGAQDTKGAGTDTLVAIENLTGSAFNDTLTGNAGDNVLIGGAGNDTLNGGEGNDTADYSAATNSVNVSLAIKGAQNTYSAGIDTLVSIENLIGHAGADDILTGDAGANILRGLGGNDRLNGGEGDDVLDGGAGSDTADYRDATKGISVDLSLSGPQNTGAGTDTLISIENIWATDFNDFLAGTAGANSLYGGLGRDTVSYASASAGVTVDTRIFGAQDTVGAGVDYLDSIENLVGSAFNDVLTGMSGGGYATLGANLAGLAGDDILSGNYLADELDGGEGDDTLYGGALNDILRSGGGVDKLYGGSGDDLADLSGSASAITASLAGGVAQNQAGTTVLDSIESLIGSAFDDVLTGSDFNDRLEGGLGNDTLYGGLGDDGLIVGLGEDFAYGGAGKDSFTLTRGGVAHLFGGAGLDSVIIAGGGTAGVTLQLGSSAAQADGMGGTIQLNSIERVIGTAFDDVITGSDGDDTIGGGLGDDTLSGGAGIDTVDYSNLLQRVTVDLRIAGPQDTGGGGIDILSGFENITGTAGDDILIGDDQNNILSGGEGWDALYGGGGDDIIDVGGNPFNSGYAQEQVFGGEGNDTLSFAGFTSNYGGYGGAVWSLDYYYSYSIENLIGSSIDDSLMGNDGDNVIEGGGGNDSLDGAGGRDTASYASAGAGVTVSLAVTSQQNTLGAGLDTLNRFENLRGSAFNDVLTGNTGSNILEGGAGDDQLDGGKGLDTALFHGARSDYVIQDLGGFSFSVTGAEGTDILSRIETLRFSDGDYAAIDFVAGPRPPAVASITSDTGGSLTDFVTRDTTLQLKGTSVGAGTVTVYLDGAAIGTAVANKAGAWSFDYRGVTLADGAYDFSASEVTKAGQTVSVGATATVIIDTHIDPVGIDTIYTQSAWAPSGAYVNDPLLILNGYAEAGSTVVVSAAGRGVVATVQANDMGMWSANYDATTDGKLTFTAKATDLAGNSAGSSSYIVTLDATAPDPQLNSAITAGKFTTLAGSAEIGGTVAVSEAGALLGSATVKSTGLWSVKLAKLTDAVHDLTIEAADKAGNLGVMHAVIGSSAADTLTGHAGEDAFVFNAGKAAGDTVVGFTSGEDRLQFQGYDLASASLTSLGGDDWRVADATHSEVIHLTGVTALTSGDYVFV